MASGAGLRFRGHGDAGATATEYQVKAAFLFNFAKFVEWPADAFRSEDAPLQICVLGQDPFDPDFEQVIAEKTVNGRRLEIIHPSGLEQAKACQIIFVAASEGASRGDPPRSARAACPHRGRCRGFRRHGWDHQLRPRR